MMVRRVSLLSLAIAGLCGNAGAQGSGGDALPLFPYEEDPLTEAKLQQLLAAAGITGDVAQLFAFDDGSGPDPSRLQSGACRAFPGDPEWPSQQTWTAFDTLLGGALIETLPVAAVCYNNLGVYNAEKCAAVQQSFTNPYFQQVTPSSPTPVSRHCKTTLKMEPCVRRRC